MFSLDFPELSAPVRTAIREQHAVRRLIPPKNHFAAQAGDADGLAADFIRFQDTASLVANHVTFSSL